MQVFEFFYKQESRLHNRNMNAIRKFLVLKSKIYQRQPSQREHEIVSIDGRKTNLGNALSGFGDSYLGPLALWDLSKEHQAHPDHFNSAFAEEGYEFDCSGFDLTSYPECVSLHTSHIVLVVATQARNNDVIVEVLWDAEDESAR